jgi:hypothetical protein
MKTFSASIHDNLNLQSASSRGLIPAMVASMRDIIALTSAGLAAIAVITLSVWAAGLEINTLLGVSTWGLGFIFLGLAVDNSGRVALFQLVTGGAFLILALLQNSVSPDFIIVSGVILATWVAVVLFKRLSV